MGLSGLAASEALRHVFDGACCVSPESAKAKFKQGIAHFAANGSSSKKYGEKRVIGHTDSGEGLNTIQRAEVKKVLGSARQMNVGRNVAVLDGKKSHEQNKETCQKTRTDYEGAMCDVNLGTQCGK